MKKTIFKKAALTLALIMIVMAFAGCVSDKKTGLTKEYFEQNKTEVLKNSVDYYELFGIPEALFDSDVQFNSADVSVDIPESGMVFNFSVEQDTENSKGNMDFGLNISEENIDLSVYYDEKKLALASDTFLGEGKSYGITFDSFDNILAKFDNSTLASMLGIEKGAAAEFCAENGINDEYINDVVKAWGDYSDFQKKYAYDNLAEELYTLYDANYGEVAEETVEVNGETKDALSLEIKCDNQIVAVALDWYMGIMEDSIAQIKKLMTSIIPEPYKEEVLPAMTEEYDSMLAEMKSEFDSILDSMELSGNMKVYIDKATGKYLMEKADIDITVDGETAKVVVTEYITDNGMAFDGTVSADEETMNISGGLTADKTEAGTNWTLSMDVSNEEYVAMSVKAGIDYTNADGSYRLYVDGNADGETIGFEATGKCAFTKDSLELTVDNIKYDDGYESENMALNIVYKARKTAEVTEPVEYVDILEMSEDELYAVIGRIGMAGESLSSLFGGASAEPDFYDEYEYGYEDDFDYEDYSYEDFALSYDDYEDYAEYYTYEEFCDFVDSYNQLLMEEYQ